LLVINTNPAAAITSQFNVTGFQPAGPVQAWQYGKAEDTAQSLSSDGSASLTYSSTSLSLGGANFSYTFPSYSMTVLDLTGSQTLTSVGVALSANNLATSGSEQFAATAYDQFGYPLVNQPTFTWSVAGGGTIDSSGNYQPPYTTGSAAIRAVAGGVSGQTTAAFPGFAQWSSGSGSWSGGSWIGTTAATVISPPGLRAATGDVALFATSGGIISLGGVNPNLAGISFASTSGYTFTGGAMTLGNGANPATITVSGGNPAIATPITLQSNLSVTVSSGDSLAISGGVAGSGQSLTMNGPGSLVLGGNNSFSGGAAVVSGKLVLASPNALPNGSNLAVGAYFGSLFSRLAAASASRPSIPSGGQWSAWPRQRKMGPWPRQA
jgi:autotransporter-associated beta strand protein